MRISYFDNARDRYPKLSDITWEFFTANLGPHEFRPGGRDEAEDKALKELCPCFSPAEYEPGATRAKRNVLQVWMLVLDVDHVDETTARWIWSRVQELGLAAVVYSSWRHGRDPWRFRVVVPLDRPVSGAAWPGFWARAITLFASVCDPQCKDAARLYFGPFAPIGSEGSHFYWVFQGGALSADAVMALPGPPDVEPTEDEELRGKHAEAAAMLADVWPKERRHEAHLALAGGLLSSGVSDDRAVDILCAVARAQDAGNEDRDKRQSTVEHTREQLDANEDIVGWGTLAMILPYDVVEKVRELVERAPTIDDLQLMRYAKQLQKSKHDYKVEMGDALEKICQQRVIPEPLVLKIATELGERFFNYDAHSIAEKFKQSLLHMRGEGEDVTVEQVETRIKQKQDEFKQQLRDRRRQEQEQKQAIELDKASRIREAYKNGRSHPYTAEELQQWAQVISTGHRWILQKDRSYYLFFHGSYKGPFSESEAHGAALRELSPARSAGVDIYKLTKTGAEFKSLRELIAEYGTVAEHIVTDLRAQVTSYDEQDRSVIEAPCPLRRLEPVYDPDVDRWMYELVGPEHYDDLKTWFALLPCLDVVRSALALIGKHSVGKSMSAQGSSRLWTKDGPCTLERALASFNDSILRCPLIFADEHLPKDFRGTVPTEQLREFIQARNRPLKRKHLPDSRCVGVTPLLIAAHDLEVLRPSENISNNEVEGSVHRFLIMQVREQAMHFLANLRPTTFERGWVDGDVIARHIWWLAYNHPHASKGRFYFTPSTPEHAMWFATSGGGKSALLRWLVSYLANRYQFDNDPNALMLVRVYQGKLLVNIQGVMSYWDKYVGNEKCPPSGLLSRLLADISIPNYRTKLPDGKGRMTNYRVVIEDYLYTWAKNTDLISQEEIARQLSVDSKVTSVGLVKQI